MTLIIDYPIVMVSIWAFAFGFGIGALIFGVLFYRERKRLMYTIRVSSEITARISSICDDLILRVEHLRDCEKEKEVLEKLSKRKK